MCTKISRERYSSRIGQPVLVRNKSREGVAIWNGFAAYEKEHWWLEATDGVKVRILSDSLVQGDVTVKIHSGEILAIGVRRDVIRAGNKIAVKDGVKLLTRPARNDFERKNGKRWPCVPSVATNGLHTFSSSDVISPQQQLPLIQESE